MEVNPRKLSADSVPFLQRSESEKWKWKLFSPVRLFATPWTIRPMNSPGQNTGVGSLSLLKRIFLTQGSNPGLLLCRWILYQLIHKGSPRILELVAHLFSSGFFQPRNWTGVFCIAGGFFTNWAIREAPNKASQGSEFILFTGWILIKWLSDSLHHHRLNRFLFKKKEWKTSF